MSTRSAPLLPPALAFVSGTALAFHLSYLYPPLLVSLLVVTFLRGRRAGVLSAVLPLISAFSLGLLWTTVRQDLPRPADPGWNADRPVTALVRSSSPWRRTAHGWSARVELRRLRQGREVERVRLPAFVTLPGDEAPPIPGTRLRVRGYLERRSGFFNGGPVEPGPWRLSVSSRRFVTVEEEAGPVARLSHALRQGVEEILDEAPPGPGAALARALILGDLSRLAPEVVRGLRRSGLGHLLALSGLHLGLAAALAWLLAAVLRLPPRIRWLLVGLTVTLYLLLAGPRPSLLRAAVLVAAGTAALALERPPAPANALGLAMGLLVLHRPSLVGNLGFQLTVAATWGILVLAPWWANRPPFPARFAGSDPSASGGAKRSPWAGLGSLLAVPVAAQIATLPWALPAFHGVSPLAPLLNLAAVPWTSLVLAAAFAWLALAAVAPAWAELSTPALDLLAAPLAWPARAPAAPWWFLPLDLPAGAAAALALGLAAALGLPARWRQAGRRWTLLAVTGAALACVPLLATFPRADEPSGSRFRLVLLDVGQGDAVLVQDGPRAVLVDGGGFAGGFDYGGGIGSRVLLPALLRLGIRRLDALVLTHGDRDHCGGLVELASWLPAEEVWTVPGWRPESCAQALVATPGVTVRRLAAGGRGRIGRWRWSALHPVWGDGGAGERNRRSLVLALQAGADGKRVLLTGDLDAAGEARLLHRFRGSARHQLAADILKVAHHGSRSSTGLPFLAAVFGVRRPESPRPLALISAGRGNPFGHPAAEVLRRLERYGARVRRTDREGRILVSVGRGAADTLSP